MSALGTLPKPDDFFTSVDLDGIHHHLRGYGETCETPSRSVVYELAVPRMIELFRRAEISATFFAVADDAAPNAAAMRALVAAGHEVASQSYTHPLPFARLDAAALEREVGASRRELERVLGRPVHGFRAPGFGTSADLFTAVARAGYAYDSSIFASPMQLAAMLTVPAQRAAAREALPLMLASRLPRRLSCGVWEAPMSLTPLLRLPFYQTLAITLGPRRFHLAVGALLRRRESLHYVLHAIDFLDAAEVDPRLHRHPGVRTPLSHKLADLEARLRRYAKGRVSLTLAQRFATA